jgi:deoxycytidylate deaminase
MRNFTRLVEISKAMKPTFQTGKFFHVTFVLKSGKIIVIATNDYNKRNVVASSYTPTKNSNSETYISGIHSENKALGKIKYRDDVEDLVLVNIRIGNNGELSNSCPCSNCAYYIGKMGIKKMFYSTNNGFERLKK